LNEVTTRRLIAGQCACALRKLVAICIKESKQWNQITCNRRNGHNEIVRYVEFKLPFFIHAGTHISDVCGVPIGQIAVDDQGIQ
jgi:hypothetical protein